MRHALLVEDQRFVADALTLMIAGAGADLAVTACRSCCSASHLVDTDEPVDLVIVDLSMPAGECLDLITALRRRDRPIPVIVIGGSEEPRLVRAVRRAGAAGFVSKRVAGAYFIAAIRAVLSGERVFPPRASSGEAFERHVRRGGIAPPDDGRTPHAGLPRRQREVLRLVADGQTNRQISKRLDLSEQTVKYHIGVLFARFGARNRLACVRAAHQAGLFERRPSRGGEEALSPG